MINHTLEQNKDSELSFWALIIYSIIRTIKDTISFEIKKTIADRNKNKLRVFGKSDYSYEINEQLNKILNDISFSSIFSYNQQHKFLISQEKYRNFSFETLLSHYLITTKPGRDYSYEILNTMKNMYDEKLLENVHSIKLFVSGKENIIGNMALKAYGHTRVLQGIEGFTLNEHPKFGRLRANTSDLAFVIEYIDSDPQSTVIFGEVEGNKGKELLKKEYWDGTHPIFNSLCK